MDAPVGFVTTSDGVRIAYAELGDGPPLVLVRGWITHLELMWSEPGFREFCQQLAAHRRLVRFDARGNGLSDREIKRPELDALVSDLEAVMDELSIGKAALWGSTFGGPIAVAYADRHPERVERLVLDGTFARGRDAWSPDQRRTFAAMVSALQDDPEMTYAAISYTTNPTPSTRHEERVARAVRSIAPELAVHLYALAVDLDVTDALSGVVCPTLVLHRRASRVVPFDVGRDLATLVRGARFVGLEGAGHNLWEEPADTALAVMCEFLGHAAPRAAVATETGLESGLMMLLFTDLVASTALTTALGDSDAQRLLHFHNATVRDAVARHGGTEVKHTGDGILARFPSASGALACALAVESRFDERNRAEPERPLLVRIGINAGEPIAEDDDVFGQAVQLAGRMCAAAEPGEIVVANVVRELAAGKGFRFDDRGEARLRGFPEPVRLFTVRR